MSNVVVTLPNGDKKETPKGTLISDFVKNSIGAGLAKAAVFAKLKSMKGPVNEDDDA